jgi:hypothetical protein
VELNAAGVLAALTAAVLAGHCAAKAARAVLAASFAVACLLLARVGLPAIDALAFSAAAALAAALVRPQWFWLPPVGAGVFGAAWASILTAQGLPWLPALLGAGALTAAAAGLAARRAGFMSADVRDEALVLVGTFALLLAVGPAAVAGWRSAQTLAAEPLGGGAPEIGPWLVAISIGSVLLGAAYAMWKRR